MKVIQLSYDHLSDHLKPCFLYLASYPKDENIEFSELKDLWSSEGFVEPTDSKSVEEVMEVYVDELMSSSLVIVRGHRKENCQIHDLVHDFCSIKARKEKLFDPRSSIVLPSSSSSSSSNLMLRGKSIRFDEHFRSNNILILFNPEKKNPSAKRLRSLKIYVRSTLLHNNVFPYNFHLRHLRLLKMLDLKIVNLPDTLLNEIGMLVHLRCLNIEIMAQALPRSFSNLSNLEILKVRVSNWGSNLVLSPSIWSLAKLRHVDIVNCSVFASDTDKPTTLQNLRTLKLLKLPCWVDSEDIFKRYPDLRSLSLGMNCSEEHIPRLDVLDKLEKNFECIRRSHEHVHQLDFHFPRSLKEVELNRFDLTSDALSRIGRSLPNLQKLELSRALSMQEWNMEQVVFHNLKRLKLYAVLFSEWQVLADESFPVLEELHLNFCEKLKEIPESFGKIASLKRISICGNKQLEESALKIKEYVTEMTGEDKLEISNKMELSLGRPMLLY